MLAGGFVDAGFPIGGTRAIEHGSPVARQVGRASLAGWQLRGCRAARSAVLVLSRVLIVCPFMGRFMLGRRDLGVYVSR